MNNTFKHYRILLFFLLLLGGPFALAQKHERPDSVSLRHVVTLGYSKYILGDGPVFGYEMQLTRRWSACISAGIGTVAYIESSFYRSGSSIASLDFRWYPLFSKRRPLSGPFVAIHTGWRSNWIKLITDEPIVHRDYTRYGDLGCNLGFQWVVHQCMTFNGQLGLGYYIGKKLHHYGRDPLPPPKPYTDYGFNGLFSFGAGIAF
ncbi:MAG: hypothetical protein KA239_10010 [Bacteroidia bacterium]|nr:hypothetical protein [Bacteroidia bacterium]